MTNKMRFYLSRVTHYDSTLCVMVSHTSQFRLVRNSFRVISRLGDGVFWYSLMSAVILVQGQKAVWPVLHIALTGLVGTLIYKWLKGKTLRPRPYQVLQDVWLTGKPLDHFSFPSGHTLHAAVFSSMFLGYYPALTLLVVPFALLVALSRVILGLHYPSDVLAGAMIGLSLASLSISLF